MTALVAAIKAHVAAGNLERALVTAIAAWREQPAPAIAELVDALDELDAHELRATRKPATLPTSAWLAEAKAAKTARARGALLRTIAERPAHDIAEAAQAASDWRDPRLVTQLIALFTALPFSGTRTREAWRQIFDAVAAQRDPRMLAFAHRAPDVWKVGDSMKTWLVNRLAEANRDLAATELPAAETEALRALAVELEPAVETAPVTEESLLADIYASPDDDGPRLVYADWLQERGDPRGEFIALQLAAQDAKSQKRQRQLLKAHEKTWLGVLEPVLAKRTEFRRGFPAKGIVKFRHQNDAEQHGAHPEWATFEELEWAELMVRDDQMSFAHYVGPTMTNLRRITGGHSKWIAAAPRRFRVERLALHYYDRDAGAFRALCASPNVPHLHTVELPHHIGIDWFDGATACPPNLEWHGRIDNAALRAWLPILAELPLQRFTVLYSVVKFHITRDARGSFTRVEAAIHPSAPVEALDPLPPIVDIVREGTSGLRTGWLTQFDVTIEYNGAMVPLHTATENAALRIVR